MVREAADEVLRIAVAVGSMHLPRMHFVVAHAAAMRAVEAQVFAIAARDSHLSPLPVTQVFDRAPLPFDVRRRLYPLADPTTGRAMRLWRPDVVNLHFLALGGFAARVAARAQVPLVTTVHALEPFLIDRPKTLRQRLLRDDARRALDASTLFLPVSAYIGRWLRDLGIEEDRATVSYAGIDEEFWRSERDASSHFSSRRVSFVGHLTELKGVRDAIEASVRLAQRLPHSLDIVGDGPLRRLVAGAVDAHPHITWHGVSDRAKVRQVLDHSTILIFPTQRVRGIEEAAGTVLLEAQAMGVPVLTYEVGGTAEMVAEPRSLVTPNDVSELTEKLHQLMTDEGVYTQLSEGARAWVLSQRSLRIRASDLRQQFAAVAGSDT